MTKIKSFFGVAVLVVVAALAFHFYDNSSPSRNGRDKVEAVLKVNWIPIRRMEPVKINYSIDGHPVYEGTFNESDWVEPIFVARGSAITLVAWQGHTTEWSLFCTITVNGVKAGPNPSVNNPDGSSTCAATAVA